MFVQDFHTSSYLLQQDLIVLLVHVLREHAIPELQFSEDCIGFEQWKQSLDLRIVAIFIKPTVIL